MTDVLIYKKGNLDTGNTQGEHHVRIKVEVRVMFLPSKEQILLGKDCPSLGTNPQLYKHPDLGLLPPEQGAINFCCLSHLVCHTLLWLPYEHITPSVKISSLQLCTALRMAFLNQCFAELGIGNQ
jgi:hypothetical protein